MINIYVWATLVICSPLYSLYGQTKISEKQYSDYIQSMIGGEREVSVDGGRIDLVTKKYVFEIEKARNWKESIGQSMWYALQTNKHPGIILILEDNSEYKYFIQLNSTLKYANLDTIIKVMLFPRDFQELIDSKDY